MEFMSRVFNWHYSLSDTIKLAFVKVACLNSWGVTFLMVYLVWCGIVAKYGIILVSSDELL